MLPGTNFELYSTLRRLTVQKKPTNEYVRKVDGSSTRSLDERLERLKEFLKGCTNTLVSTSAPGGPQAPPSVLIPETVASDSTSTTKEVAEPILLLRNTKAAGIDGVAAETLKAGGDVLIIHLQSLLKLV